MLPPHSRAVARTEVGQDPLSICALFEARVQTADRPAADDHVRVLAAAQVAGAGQVVGLAEVFARKDEESCHGVDQDAAIVRMIRAGARG